MATAKKSSVKKPAPKAAAKAGSLETKVKQLEARVSELEEQHKAHFNLGDAGDLWEDISNKAKKSYRDNPGLTIAVFVLAVLVLFLLIS